MHLRPASIIAVIFIACLELSAQSPDWRTPAEISDYRTTPDYAATMAYLERIAAAAPGQVRIENFGKTGEGRDLKIVIASKDGVFDPAAIHASGRAVLLVQNAIHAGEMDGKDSCLALLRDIVVTKAHAAVLDHVVFVFIPVYNLDGHERPSAYNRINQNGPDVMGWRGNGTNNNLNRDYMKADAAGDARVPEDVPPLDARFLCRRPRDRRRGFPVRRDVLRRFHARRRSRHRALAAQRSHARARTPGQRRRPRRLSLAGRSPGRHRSGQGHSQFRQSARDSLQAT